MPKKKIEVVELNKKEDKIILEEEPSALILFWRRYRKAIFLILLLLSLLLLSLSTYLFMKNLNKSEEMVIKKVSVNTSLGDFELIDANRSLDDQSAKDDFFKNDSFKTKGEVLLLKTVESSTFTIKFYSDGTALKIMKDGSSVTRILPLKDGQYGISSDGVVSSNAKTSTVSISEVVDYPWGKVTFLSDGSAIVNNSKMDVFVRDSKDVKGNYISDNKETYLKETKNVGNVKLYYYNDGTIEVVKNNKSYLVRDESDLNITNNSVTFKNNNEATIYQTKKTDDGYTIDYYTDGGAIIRDGSKTLSVRKSNSIVIKDNKIYEIVDNIYVTVSNVRDNVTYYTNGSAVVTNYNGSTLYVPENSDIKYNNGNNIKSVGDNTEKLTKETNVDDENVKTFEKTAVVKTDKYIAIVPKEGVIYDKDGKVKDLDSPKDDDGKKTFTITNDTNEDLNYLVAIEQSPRTTVNVSYIRYQLSTNAKYIEPSKLKNETNDDKIFDKLFAYGTNYILIKDTIKAQTSEDISLMLWTDYDTIPNSEMDKYFYGTIKVYAWTEEEK